MDTTNINTATVAGCCGAVGLSLVKQLLESGVRVVGFCKDEKDPRISDLLRIYEGQFIALSGDLTDQETSRGLVASAQAFLNGPIDAHFHAVGVYSWNEWQNVSGLEVTRLWNANFTSAWVLGRELFSAMKLGSNSGSNSGSIMYVSARDTIRSAPTGFGPYLASKAALNMYVQSLASEGVHYGINVNAVLPTIIDTEVNRKGLLDQDPSDWVSPEQLAGTMIDLSMPNRSNISGALIPVQGKLI